MLGPSPGVTSSEVPFSTILAGGHHHALAVPAPADRSFLIAYYGQDSGHRLSQPLGTITTRDRYALLTLPPLSPADLDALLAQTGFRMLAVSEIRKAMGFPDGYELLGTKRDQVKQLGNAVTPDAATELARRAVAILN